MILILEDDAERTKRFQAVLQALNCSHALYIWRDAHTMILEAGPLLESSLFLSLDHDLFPESGEPDPGDGYMVAQWLTSMPVVKPVIIHSSNGERAGWMAGEFDLAGWPHWRVLPFGDDWIETDWRRIVRKLIKTQSRKSN
ncbi:MAG: cyclic-phosphate processing receiver domain-containing protein [Zavarzinella sp.]